jgi:hypothetical protein
MVASELYASALYANRGRPELAASKQQLSAGSLACWMTFLGSLLLNDHLIVVETLDFSDDPRS